VGDAQFVINTQNALDIVKQSPTAYKILTQYIGIIKQSPSSGMAAYLNLQPFKLVTQHLPLHLQYASCIVHDAYHSKLYNDYLATHKSVPRNISKIHR